MKRLFTFVLLICSISVAHSQIKYTSNGKLIFGNGFTSIPYDHQECATGWYGAGHYFGYITSSGQYPWMKISLEASNVRISGNDGYIVFHNNTDFNDIYVKNVYTASDARLKSDIKPLEGALSLTKRLKPKSYGWASPSAPSNGKTSKQEMGFLAQDLEELIPEAVTTDSDGTKLVNYNTIIPVLAGAIQELEATVAALQARIAELEAK